MEEKAENKMTNYFNKIIHKILFPINYLVNNFYYCFCSGTYCSVHPTPGKNLINNKNAKNETIPKKILAFVLFIPIAPFRSKDYIVAPNLRLNKQKKLEALNEQKHSIKFKQDKSAKNCLILINHL